jgi:hypothetical protein
MDCERLGVPLPVAAASILYLVISGNFPVFSSDGVPSSAAPAPTIGMNGFRDFQTARGDRRRRP